MIFTACPNPNCARREFSSRSARDNHVYRYKQKGYCPNENRKSDTSKIRAEPVSQINQHITHPFSDEWRCEKCLHRFTSLEAAEEHYQKRHVEKIPYESETAKQSQVETPVNITEYLNELARRRAQELRQSLYVPQQGIVKQQLLVSEPQVETREPESEPKKQERPNTELDSKPQSPVIINALKSLFRNKGKMQAKEPIAETRQIFMSSRGVGVDGVSILWNPRPNYCKNDKVWLYDFEVQQHVVLGHTVVRQG